VDYGRFLDLLEHERREEVARFRDSGRAAAPDAEREARGDALVRLEIVDEEAGLAGRWLVTLARAGGGDLAAGALDVGTPVALTAPDVPKGSTPPHGVVARRTADRIVVALEDEPPEWVEGPRLRLERLPDDTTIRKLRAAVERVRDARKGQRLLELRQAFDGEKDLAVAPKPLPVDAASLDASQTSAVAFALAAPEVALIHGPPGTGKTTTVVALIAEAIGRGQRVLACAASNAAVDVLAERLEQRGLNPVRIGHPARITPAVLASSLDERVRSHADAKIARELLARSFQIRRKLGKWTRAAPDWEERRALRDEAKALRDDARRLARVAIEKILDAAPVVCATLTAAEGYPLGERTFDLVVIDEAAQALEPACWIAIARAAPRTGRVVLAGDHKQLPPTVLSLKASEGGLARTLFARLHERFGERAARMLTTQYRMHEAIQAFPSARFYEGRLEAAAANRRHLLAEIEGVELKEPWTSEPLALFDTSGCGFEDEREAGDGGSVRNPGEADLVAKIVREVLGAGVPARDVGVIAPYSAQVAAIRDRLADEVAAGLEVATADGFQGREREAIVVSLTRSNEDREIGFLADHRRANVALTRARRALFVVGDGSTLSADAFFAALLEHYEKAGALRSAYELM
jgi:ATP-dependent RNA/DNA helicase IGHMBP2